MLKYVVILLDATSTAFCHADNPNVSAELMPIDVLRKAIFWSMKENLTIHFVYPDYELPEEYHTVINSIDHVDIKHNNHADVIVLNNIHELKNTEYTNSSLVLRIKKDDLSQNVDLIARTIENNVHLSVIIKNIEQMNEADFEKYNYFLTDLAIRLEELYVKGKSPKINILSDRISLDSMSNCNAGWESITISPNGEFYICPAFYYEKQSGNVGNLIDGLNIKNPQLYKLDHAPICRKCDAYHCRRCVWLNKRTTYEVNTPSHEQCVTAHLERNASRKLLYSVRKHGDFLPGKEIGEIQYLDPFDIINI